MWDNTWTTDFNWTSNMLLAQTKLISIFHWTAWFWKISENGIAVRKSKLNQFSNIQTNRGNDMLFWVFHGFILNHKSREPSTETWKEALHWVTSLFLKTCCIWFSQGNFTSSEKNPVHTQFTLESLALQFCFHIWNVHICHFDSQAALKANSLY